MMQVKQRAPLFFMGLLLLLLQLFFFFGFVEGKDDSIGKFGDSCDVHEDCQFPGSICDETKHCYCNSSFPITNHLDKCGIARSVNESCFFHEQCEAVLMKTECKGGFCVCRHQFLAILQDDGKFDCIPQENTIPSTKFIDPAMILILVVMFLMFITICIVMRLFSKARWSDTENRSIFNTPNPRLMNASLFRESTKQHHGSREGSKGSRGPSRPESVTSLQPPLSPNSTVSRRNSNTSETAKLKSPTDVTPMLEKNASSASSVIIKEVVISKN